MCCFLHFIGCFLRFIGEFIRLRRLPLQQPPLPQQQLPQQPPLPHFIPSPLMTGFYALFGHTLFGPLFGAE